MIINWSIFKKMRLNLVVICEHSAPVKTHKQSYLLPFLFSAWDATAMIWHILHRSSKQIKAVEYQHLFNTKTYTC